MLHGDTRPFTTAVKGTCPAEAPLGVTASLCVLGLDGTISDGRGVDALLPIVEPEAVPNLSWDMASPGPTNHPLFGLDNCGGSRLAAWSFLILSRFVNRPLFGLAA